MTIRNPDFGVFPQSKIEFPLLEGVIDEYQTEEHGLDSEVTTLPTADGRPITDNIVRHQRTLKLRAVVSEYASPDGASPEVRPGAAWSAIDEMHRNRDPVMIVTPLYSYENLVLVKASAPVDDSTGRRSLFVDLEFKEVLSTTIDRLAPDADDVDDPILKDYVAPDISRGYTPSYQWNATDKLLVSEPIAAKAIEGKDLAEDPDDRWAGLKSAIRRAWDATGVDARSLARPGGLDAAVNQIEVSTMGRLGAGARQKAKTVFGNDVVDISMAWLPTAQRWHTTMRDGDGNALAAGLALGKHGQPLAGVPTGGRGQPPGEIVVLGTREPGRDSFADGDSEIAFVSTPLRREA